LLHSWILQLMSMKAKELMDLAPFDLEDFVGQDVKVLRCPNLCIFSMSELKVGLERGALGWLTPVKEGLRMSR